MRVTVISPERAIFDGDATAVTAPAYDGLVGILPGHALSVRVDGQERNFAVRQGFLQVIDDSVRVVAEQATIEGGE
ncbi:MAG: F0F1 ATP synthase subunit epsilon [Gemmatimonadales bacterium]|nr:F0F1 ATP synthase subunit epsilon [Gemmatimonadales bacterium]